MRHPNSIFTYIAYDIRRCLAPETVVRWLSNTAASQRSCVEHTQGQNSRRHFCGRRRNLVKVQLINVSIFLELHVAVSVLELMSLLAGWLAGRLAGWLIVCFARSFVRSFVTFRLFGCLLRWFCPKSFFLFFSPSILNLCRSWLVHL